MNINNDTIELINRALEKVMPNITLPMALRLIMSILRQMYPERDFDSLYKLIFFNTNPSLSFQKSDVSHVYFYIDEEKEFVSVEVVLNFLSIFGASSPLPHHYSETVLANYVEDKVLSDFLSMYNHRLKRLIYPIWRQQRYYIQYENDLTDEFSGYILSFMGLYGEETLKETTLNLHKLLPYAGILSMKQKSTVSLVSMLKHYFSHKDITIEEAIVSKSLVPKEQQAVLGENNSSLGLDMSIGTFVITRNLKFRIHFNNIAWDTLYDFGVWGTKRKKLREFMNYIQTDPLDYDISVHIKQEDIKPCIMNESSSISLGTNGWLGEIKSDKTIAIL